MVTCWGTTSCPREAQPGRVRVNNTRPGTGRAGTLDASVQTTATRAAKPPWPPGSYAARRSRELTDGDQLMPRTPANGPCGHQQAARPDAARADIPARAGSRPSGRD